MEKSKWSYPYCQGREDDCCTNAVAFTVENAHACEQHLLVVVKRMMGHQSEINGRSYVIVDKGARVPTRV